MTVEMQEQEEEEDILTLTLKYLHKKKHVKGGADVSTETIPRRP
jgi:hypothetical protein